MREPLNVLHAAQMNAQCKKTGVFKIEKECERKKDGEAAETVPLWALLTVVNPLIGSVCRQEVWVLNPHKQKDNVCQLSLVTCPISLRAEFVISWVSHCDQTEAFSVESSRLAVVHTTFLTTVVRILK